MNFPFFPSLFKSKKYILNNQKSFLIENIKTITNKYNLILFSNQSIFHHNEKTTIPLLLLHPLRGLFLFEYKEWSYDDLKDVSIEKAINVTPQKNNTAFQSLQNTILSKYKELTHTDDLKFSNFLLIENLNRGEYDLLDNSFKELLPKDRIIFNDTSDEEIIEILALKELSEQDINLLFNPEHILPNIFIQYALFDDNQTLFLLSSKQREFIDVPLKGHQKLSAQTGSGKTNTIILKALIEQLQNPQKHIIIIEPTRIASDIVRQKLLMLIEHAIVSINPLSIEILTPQELINQQLAKSNKPQLYHELHIDEKLFSKSKKIADLVICDDAELLTPEFIKFITLLQKKDSLLLVSNDAGKDFDFRFPDSFTNHTKKVIFKQANKHAKSMQIIRELSTHFSARDILVVSHSSTKEALKEDLEFFIEDKAILLDSSTSLLSQKLDSLLLASYSEISSLHSRFVLLMDIGKATANQINHAIHLATDTLYIIYEENCEMIEKLKEQYESKT